MLPILITIKRTATQGTTVESSFTESAKLLVETLLSPRALMIMGGLFLLLAVGFLALWIRKRHTSFYLPGTARPAAPNRTNVQSKNAHADELLRQVPGISNPGPGNVVGPEGSEGNSNSQQAGQPKNGQ